MDRKKAYQQYCRKCWWLGRLFRSAATGSFASAQNWSQIIGLAVVAYLLRTFGFPMTEPATITQEIGVAALYVVVAWFVVYFLRLAWFATFARHKIYGDGQWYGRKFVYREPRLAFHFLASPEANNHVFKFRFRDAPPFAFIEYKFVLDGPSDFVSVIVIAHPSQWPDFKSETDRQYTCGGISVNKSNDLYIKAYLRQSADPFSIRVYVKSWEDRLLPDQKPDYRSANFEPARWV